MTANTANLRAASIYAAIGEAARAARAAEGDHGYIVAQDGRYLRPATEEEAARCAEIAAERLDPEPWFEIGGQLVTVVS